MTNPIDRATRELLSIHANSRAAHFDKDVAALMAIQPEDFTYAGNGVVRRLSRADMRHNIEQAFANSTYHEFDDLEPPIVRVSEDGTVGWMITRIKVRKTETDSAGAKRERETIHASIRTFEKRDGRWFMTATS